MRRLLPFLLLAALAAGCGGSSGDSSGTTTASAGSTTTPVSPAPMTLTVFPVVDGRLTVRAVTVPRTRAVAHAALEALGITAPVRIAGGTATVSLDGATSGQLASIVYTLTRFASVRSVDVGMHAGLTRADVESFVPPILIESPVEGASVPLAFTVSGTASVFEATLVVELVRDGKVLEHRTVTASEGAPGRGTFSVELHAPSAGAATVAAYSPSAADGSRQHEQDVHVTVTP
jgi:hypothetical protein